MTPPTREEINANRIRIALREYDCYHQLPGEPWQKIGPLAYSANRRCIRHPHCRGGFRIARVKVRGAR